MYTRTVPLVVSRTTRSPSRRSTLEIPRAFSPIRTAERNTFSLNFGNEAAESYSSYLVSTSLRQSLSDVRKTRSNRVNGLRCPRPLLLPAVRGCVLVGSAASELEIPGSLTEGTRCRIAAIESGICPDVVDSESKTQISNPLRRVGDLSATSMSQLVVFTKQKSPVHEARPGPSAWFGMCGGHA